MRTHSIKTSYLIHKTLAEDTTLMTLISDNNIFLLIAEADTEFPYITITRTGISGTAGDKDSSWDDVSFNISVYSDRYEDAADIADAARLALENHILQDENIRLENIRLISADEDFKEDTYIQTLNFRAECYKSRAQVVENEIING